MSSEQHDFAPLAIIGMGSLFPKADDLEAYWANIKHGVDAITEVPETHWRPEDYFDEDQKRPDFTYGRRGGFLNTHDFDPLKYGIPPNVIEATDTSQLLGMVAAEAAMRDAGYGPDRDFDRDRVSVILGVTGALELVVPLGARLGHPMWRRSMQDAGISPEQIDAAMQNISDSYVSWQENSFPGLLGNVVAGRISKYLNTGGTNCVVDAACASSISAIHLAALELATGKADMVVSGGVDTFNDIFMYMCFSKTPALSPSGNSKPFDNHGDGTILGEGLGIVVLKRLADAERDGDKIYAVIKGIGSSSDGKGEAIYAPSSPGQEKALREAYRVAGVSPDTIELLEAHGTGTKKGDAVEAVALKRVYGEAGSGGSWCALGSVKSQIGHTKSAAGAAGLMKAALALHHKVLPPTIKVDEPHEEVLPGRTPFYLNTDKRPWAAKSEHPRRAAVSAFGFGGSNFHAVLEEYSPKKPAPDWDGIVQVAPFSAASVPALKEALEKFPAGDWNEIRNASAKVRASFDASAFHRAALVIEKDATDVPALLAQAIRALDSNDPDKPWSTPGGAYYGAGNPEGATAFLFPGQGAQYPGMLGDLACLFPEMIETLSDADAALEESMPGARLSDRIYPHPAFDKETEQRNEAELRATDVAQPAIGAVSIGAAHVLSGFGVSPAAVAGHSYGELTALCAAGVIDEEAFVRISRLRGELMGEGRGEKGSMAAVRAPAETVETVLREESLDLIIANKNTPEQSVLSGATAEIDRAVDAFKQRKIGCTKLSVAAAFHSRFVSDAEEPLLDALDATTFGEPWCVVYSNTTGSRYPSESQDARDLLASQLARPVEFVREITTMYDDGVRTFVEVGPGARLTGMVKAILGDRDYTAVAVDASNGKKSGVADLARCLAQLGAAGHAVSFGLWDARDPEIPADKPRMTIPISGANYRASRPEREPMAARPRVEPAKPEPKTARSAPAPKRHEAPAAPPAPAPGRHETPAAPPVPPPAIPSAEQPRQAPPAHVNELLQQTQANIAALQQMQERTAKLHSQFLQGQELAAKTFQTLLSQQQRVFQSPAQNAPAAAAPAPQPVAPVAPAAPPPEVHEHEKPPRSVPAPAEPAPRAAKAEPPDRTREILLEVVSEKTGYPVEMLELGMSLDADLGIDSIKRVEILSAMQERVPGLPAIEADQLGAIQTLSDIVAHLQAADSQPETVVELPPASAPDDGALVEALLAVVSEKTGYPAEMLDLDMAMESDLGIDSIKRVEILSAMQERIPGLPSIEADALGRLQTLRDVVDHVTAAEPKSAPVPVPAAAADADHLRAVLLAVVSEKTGYPADMLDFEMSLDADLGIDSIKRVEILSTLQEEIPGLPAVEAEDLGKLQTLNDVVGILGTLSASAAAGAMPPGTEPASPPEPAGGEEPGRISRQVLECVPLDLPLSRPMVFLREEAVIWVTDDQAGLSNAIVERFHLLGFDATVVNVRDTGRDSLPDRLDGLVIVAPPAGVDDRFLRQAFERAQRSAPLLRKSGEADGALFATVSRLDGAFGLAPATLAKETLSGALAGLAKTAGHEWHDVSCKAVDVAYNVSNLSDIAAAVVDEILQAGPPEVGISDNGRYALQLASAPRVDAGARLPITSEDVIVISGGGRGVTAEIAVALAREYGPNIVLLGRSAAPRPEEEWLAELRGEAEIKRALLERGDANPTPQELNRQYVEIAANRELEANLHRIEDAGARVTYRQVDVRDARAVAEVLEAVREHIGPIAGIVHGAGVIADKLIEEKTLEQFKRVFDTKVAGMRALLSATEHDALKLVAFFSSSTGRFGRTGQVDYAMANEVLNKTAQALAAERPGCRIVAINWGPWDGGMVTPALKKLFESEGVNVIDLEAGAEYFLDEIALVDGPAEVVVLGGAAESAGTHAPAAPRQGVLAVSDETLLELELDTNRFHFLRSHVIDGRAVLPVAVYVEWLAHAALHANPGLRFHGVEGLRVFKGVILENGHVRTLRVCGGKALKQDGTYRVPVELQSIGADGVVETHARAEALLADRLPQGKRKLESVILGDYPCAHDEIYGDAGNPGLLFHGDAFHAIQEVEGCSDKGITGIAYTAPRPAEWIDEPLRKSWLADPLVVDSAFQLLILWSRNKSGAASLPTAFGAYHQFLPSFPKGRVQVVVRVEETGEHRSLSTVEFLNPKNGALIARIEDCECVIDASLNNAFLRNTIESRATAQSDSDR